MNDNDRDRLAITLIIVLFLGGAIGLLFLIWLFPEQWGIIRSFMGW